MKLHMIRRAFLRLFGCFYSVDFPSECQTLQLLETRTRQDHQHFCQKFVTNGGKLVVLHGPPMISLSYMTRACICSGPLKKDGQNLGAERL